jgi:uncharacterized protein (TIGR02996 family)
MRVRDAFLAAVVAHPDDDLPRLIFADWLDEHGDGARAELIRLQCAAARGEPAALTPNAVRRARELEDVHRDAWLGPLPRSVWRAEFRRGFVEHVALPAQAFLADGPALRRLAPLRGVTLVGARRVLPELLDGPHLRGLAALHLTGGRLGDDGARLLAAAPEVAGLTTLRLGDNALGDAGAAALARSPHLAALTKLVLCDNALGDGGAWELARAPFLTRLVELDLAGNEIGPAGVEALRAPPRLTALTELDLTGQRVPSGRRLRLPAAAK